MRPQGLVDWRLAAGLLLRVLPRRPGGRPGEGLLPGLRHGKDPHRDLDVGRTVAVTNGSVSYGLRRIAWATFMYAPRCRAILLWACSALRFSMESRMAECAFFASARISAVVT